MIPDLISWELLGPLRLYQKTTLQTLSIGGNAPKFWLQKKLQMFGAYTNFILVFDLIILIFAMILTAVDWDKKAC